MKTLFVELPSSTRFEADYLDDDSFRALIPRGTKGQVNGKRTLQTHEVSIQPPAEINAGQLLALRASLSRAKGPSTPPQLSKYP